MEKTLEPHLKKKESKDRLTDQNLWFLSNI